MITIQPAGDPHKLEPLTCRRSALEIEVAGSTLHHALVERWLPAAEDRSVTARSDFWPSRGLIEKLRQINGGFSVLFQGREVAASGSGSRPVIEPGPDDGSFLIVYPWHILKVKYAFVFLAESSVCACPHKCVSHLFFDPFKCHNLYQYPYCLAK